MLACLFYFYFNWYFVTKIVLTMRKNSFSDQEKVLKFEAEGQEFAKCFLLTECFLTCSWRFFMYNNLEQLEFKLEKKYWDLETCRKS